jgi:hypothetical protein
MPISVVTFRGRRLGRRWTTFFLLSAAAAVFATSSGCGSRSTASRSNKPDPNAILREAAQAPALADSSGDPPGDPKEPKLELRLNRTEIDADSELAGTIGGSPGESRLTLLWVDGAQRVIGVIDVTPPKEKRDDQITFSIPVPKTAIGQLQRLVLIRGSSKDKDKNDPARLESQALFQVRAPAVWDDYVAMVHGVGGLDDATIEHLRQLGISGGTCGALEMPGLFARHTMSFCNALFPHEETPFGARANWSERVANYLKAPSAELLQRDPPLFDEQALAKDFQRIDAALAAKHGFVPLGWCFGKDLSLTNASAPFDYDMSPSTIQVFQGWLEKRYGKLDALNAQWGTSYKSWNDIRPPTTDSVLNFKRGAPVTAMAPDNKDPKDPRETHAPATKVPEPSARRMPGHENFSAWSDFRTFNDFAFARLLKEYRAKLTQTEPFAHPGLVGIPPPSVFGGWDYWQVAKLLDWAEEHESPQGRALLRNFAPQIRFVSQVSGTGRANIYELWNRWMTGDFGCIVDSKTLNEDASELSADLKFLASGVTRLRENAEAVSSTLAIYYSPRSMQVQWLLDCQEAGTDWLLRDSTYEATHNSALLSLKAWSMLLEDLGYAPRFIYPNDVISGALDKAKIRAVLLPKVVALSDAEALALRKFALSGGIVIADGACGTFDGSGRRRGTNDTPVGVLDGDFGIARKDLRVNESNGTFTADAAESVVTMRDGINKEAIGPEGSELKVLEPGITVRGGRAHAWSANGAAALLNKSAGVGRFIYLNLSVQNYPTLREAPMGDDFIFHGMSGADYVKKYGLPTGGEALRLVIGDVLSDIVLANPLHVWSAEGTPLRGFRRAEYFLGRDADVFAIIPLGRTDDGLTTISGQSITEPTPIWVGLDHARHWYDVRTGGYLGWGRSVKVTADPVHPLLLSALPYMTDHINLKIGRTDPRGTFKVQAALSSSLQPVVHVFHLDITDPAGKVLQHYTQNVVAEGGKWNGEIILGVNEPTGHYRLVVRDVATGATGIGDLAKDFADYAELINVAPKSANDNK